MSDVDLRTIELKIARGENLPTLPEAVTAVFKIADDPSTTARDIERLIEHDPALTAKVLRVVNSPAYGVGTIASVGRALAVLGTNRVRSLLISVAFQSLVADKTEGSKFNKLEFWRHSLAVATAARVFGRIKAPDLAEELYCTGILHDVGLIIMDKFCPDMLDQAIRLAEFERVPLVEAEARLLPFTHAQLGGTLAAKWGLGQNIQSAVQGHHDPDCLASPSSPAALVQVSDVLAHEVGFTNQLPEVPYKIEESVMNALGLPPEQFQVLRDVMYSEVEKAEQAFKVNESPQRRPVAA